MKYSNLIQKIIDAKTIVIYGAGTMGRAVRKCLSEAPFFLTIQCFIVKSLYSNNNYIDGLRVKDIAHALEYKDATVLIALNGKMIPEVIQDLTAAGFNNFIPISFDGDEWTIIRENWIRSNNILPQNIQDLSNLNIESRVFHNGIVVGDANLYLDNSSIAGMNSRDLLSCIHVFVAHSVYDKKLYVEPKEQPYELDIQVGAALTDKVLYDVRDSLGEDNISYKNRQYCELTGIFWAWKNDKTDYIGFSHYRRRFSLSEKQLRLIVDERIDVVVTEPILNFETVREQYAKDHCIKDWDVLIGVINKLSPEYATATEIVQKGIYYFAYNMFIMKREVFHRYCSFIFPILLECEKLIGDKEDVYQNRYIGFLAERLLSVFLEFNKQYSVAIAEKHFLE